MGRKSKSRRQNQCACYYCDREFENENVLIEHQKARHFRCPVCNKRMTTVSALSVHMAQVHKEQLKKVPNAKEGRDSTELQIFGMNGVPDDFLESVTGIKRPRTDEAATTAVHTPYHPHAGAMYPGAAGYYPPPAMPVPGASAMPTQHHMYGAAAPHMYPPPGVPGAYPAAPGYPMPPAGTYPPVPGQPPYLPYGMPHPVPPVPPMPHAAHTPPLPIPPTSGTTNPGVAALPPLLPQASTVSTTPAPGSTTAPPVQSTATSITSAQPTSTDQATATAPTIPTTSAPSIPPPSFPVPPVGNVPTQATSQPHLPSQAPPQQTSTVADTMKDADHPKSAGTVSPGPISSAPSDTGASAAPVDAPTPEVSEFPFPRPAGQVYTVEEFSPEEMRAKNQKYTLSSDRVAADVQKLQKELDIDTRLRDLIEK